MIEALLDIMKRSFWILHLSEYVTTSTIAAIIVVVPWPAFLCAGAHRAITAELGWTRCFGLLPVTGVTALPVRSDRLSVNWPPRSLSRFIERLRGHRRHRGTPSRERRQRWRGRLEISGLWSQAPGLQWPHRKCRLNRKIIFQLAERENLTISTDLL